jgi:malate/lactate dehydrogenase
VNHGTVNGKPIREVLADSADWLDGEFISVVQQRGAAIIKVREQGKGSAGQGDAL